jgi:hypothetical protein
MLSARIYNNKITIKQAASQKQILINGRILSQNIPHPNVLGFLRVAQYSEK